MTKEFTFKKRFWDSTADNGHKGLICNLGAVMDSLGNKFLAGTGFSINKHVGRGWCYAFNQVKDFQHFWALPDNLRKTFILFTLVQGLFTERLVDNAFYLINIKGFCYIVKGAMFHGIDSIIRRGKGCNKYKVQIWLNGL